jgi:hypothetical protein
MGTEALALANRTALVTGAGARIGRATALALAARGANVVVHYLTSRRGAEATAAQIRRLGRRAWTIRADLGDARQAEKLFGRAQKLAGPIDILINSAAVFPKSRLRDVTAAELAADVQVNAMAPLQLARAFAAQGRRGDVINFLDCRIGSQASAHVAYLLSKQMLHGLTRMMALEFAPRIRVNAIAPGLILPPPGADSRYFKRLAKTNPLGTHGDVGDVTEAVLFLLRSRFVTGQVIFVDGGRHLRGSAMV